jgi:transposase-like protein
MKEAIMEEHQSLQALQGFDDFGNLQPEAEELRRLRRENDILRQERDILKTDEDQVRSKTFLKCDQRLLQGNEAHS